MSVQVVRNEQEMLDLLQENDRVLLKATAEWCGPCKAIQPYLDAMADAYEEVAFAVFDVDAAEDLAEILAPTALPTFFSYYKGQAVAKSAGASKKYVNDLINHLVQLGTGQLEEIPQHPTQQEASQSAEEDSQHDEGSQAHSQSDEGSKSAADSQESEQSQSAEENDGSQDASSHDSNVSVEDLSEDAASRESSVHTPLSGSSEEELEF